MQLRYRRVLPLVAFCLALAAVPALAAKPAPVPMGPVNDARQEVQVGSPPSTGVNVVNCELGTPPPTAVAFGYIFPPDDEYYQFIDPAACPDCNGGPLLYSKAHVLLYFTAPCQIPVQVSINPAFAPAGSGCYAPNPFMPPLCDAIQYTVDDAGFLGQCVDYQLPLSSACCVSGPVFLKFQFDQGTCPNNRPGFCARTTCSNCQQYNYYPGAISPGDDLCAILQPQIGAINFWVDATCCGATPTHKGSWGQMKTLYR